MKEYRAGAGQKRKTRRRILVKLFCFCILFTSCFNMCAARFCFAEENAQQDVQETETAKSEDTAQAQWQSEAGGAWQTGSFSEAVSNVYSGGTVKVLSDVSIEEGITISKSITVTSNDKQNPCTIKNTTQDTKDGKAAGRIFTVNGGPLTLEHIILDGGRDEGIVAYHPLICVTRVGMMVKEGAVLQNNENAYQNISGGAVSLLNGQVLMYEGSQIRRCKATEGGGIEINSSTGFSPAVLGMFGGSIEECEANNGGGVYINNGQFQMLGGKIKANRAVAESYGSGGGGIFLKSVDSSRAAAVLIRNGEITGNSAYKGGGILVNGNYTLLQVEGGMIAGNSAANGGGVSVLLGTMKLYNGTVTENMAVSYGGGILGSPFSVIELKGSPQVFDNRTGDEFDNFYLDGAEDTEPAWSTAPVRMVGALGADAKLGMSRWLRPDEDEHPARVMIEPYGGYTVTKSDLDRLYADNKQRYALILYDEKICMVLAVDVTLDKEELRLSKEGQTAGLAAKVTPENAPIQDVTWESSNPDVASVDENGVVTAVGEGTAVITVRTVSPYNATASCNVTVGTFRYMLTTIAEHGTIIFTADRSLAEEVEEGARISFRTVADKGYQLKEKSLRAYLAEDEAAEVGIKDGMLIMPAQDVVVTAEFEPIEYPIVYHLEGGALKNGDANPERYTIESGTIVLHNPHREGYCFVGWKGTELAKTESSVAIPSGSTGERSYTAIWEKEEESSSVEETEPSQEEEESSSVEETEPSQEEEESSSVEETEPSQEEEESSVEETEPSQEEEESSAKETEPSQEESSENAAIEDDISERISISAENENEQVKSPLTDGSVLLLYAAVILSVFGMLLPGLWIGKKK